MKYDCRIEINKPINKVVELFDDPNNLHKWMDGLKSIEHLEGIKGEPGAKSKFIFERKGKKTEMIGTIISRNLPDEFSGTYDMTGVHNIQRYRFQKIDENKTMYISESEFQFKGVMKWMEIMSFAFKKQTMKFMENFKQFVENEK